MRTHGFYFALSAVCLILLFSTDVWGQRRTSTGSMQLGQRWATPGGGSGQTWSPVPGRSSSSPAWSLRPTYSNSRSAASRYDASLNHRGRSYSTAPGPVQYSPAQRHGHRHSYSVVPQVFLQYQDYGGYYSDFGHGGYSGLNAYDQLRLLNGISPRYGVNYGAVYPTIVAPPLVVPHGLNSVNGGLGSSAMYQQTSPSVFFPEVNSLPSAGDSSSALPEIGDQENSRSLPVDERPVRDEFGEVSLAPQTSSNAVDRIRSLRYQASADDAFRRQDYAAAAALYKAAKETAPDRRAPRLRHVWALCARGDYVNAAIELKDVLVMPEDATSAWISGDALYGSTNLADRSLHSDNVWNWLQERPNSTDRLLLAAAVQKLRGSDSVARELLQTASHAGLQERLRRGLDEISTVERDQEAPANSLDPDEGLRMQGSTVMPVVGGLQVLPGMPEPLGFEDEERVPEPQGSSDLQPYSDPATLVIPAK